MKKPVPVRVESGLTEFPPQLGVNIMSRDHGRHETTP